MIEIIITIIVVMVSNIIIPIVLFTITEILFNLPIGKTIISTLTKPLFNHIRNRVERDPALHHPGKEFNIHLLYFFYLFGGVSIYQFLYLIPITLQLIQEQKFNIIKGIIIGVICTFLLNGGCFLKVM